MWQKTGVRFTPNGPYRVCEKTAEILIYYTRDIFLMLIEILFSYRHSEIQAFVPCVEENRNDALEMINCSWPILDSHLARVWALLLPLEEQLDLMVELLNTVNNIICNRIDGNKWCQLTHLSRMEFPILINWTSPFRIQGLFGGIFISNPILIKKKSVSKQ